jgi:hypothetical protein
MSRTPRWLALVLLIGLCPASQAAGPYGADNGWAIDNSGNALLTAAVATKMSQGETGWIRIEMRLIPGHTNWDSAMLGYYDTAVNNARNAGLQVLLLIDGGSWPGNQTNWEANSSEKNPGLNGDNLYVEGYATNAVVPIVQHFRNRVKHYELWNEPNSWTTSVGVGGTYLYPSNYGWLLARSWEAVHKTLQIDDVTLFFGGVFGHNISGITSYGNAGAQYIDDTYSTGTNVAKGNSFAYIKSKYNAYPLDGVGEHIYIDTGGLVSSNTFRQYEDWVLQAYTKYEGTSTLKKTFITEFGWQTTNSSNIHGVSQATQDTNLITAFSAIQATPYVQMAIWFQWQDNPAGNLYYGVVDSSGNAKQSYPDYQHFQRFEGVNPNGTTNSNIRSYFIGLGQSILGNPYDNGNGAWIYTLAGGSAQDFNGGSHSNLLVMTSTNGTFEVNNLHGLWNFYTSSNGPVNFGYPRNNEFTAGGGTRQDFTGGDLTWDAVNLVVWHPLPSPPTGLAATGSNALVTLRWNASSLATGYNVKRSTVNGGLYTKVAGNVALTNYTDTSLVNGTNYFYVVTATNNAGESANSLQAVATPVAPPSINTQPQSQTVDQGASAAFNVAADSTAPLSYQWQFNGVNISGATTNSLLLENVQPANAGNYVVMISNYGGSVTSSNAFLTVRPVLAAVQAGNNLIITWSGSYTLQSATNAAGPYLDVTGATSPYTNANVMPQQFYRLRN